MKKKVLVVLSHILGNKIISGYVYDAISCNNDIEPIFVTITSEEVYSCDVPKFLSSSILYRVRKVLISKLSSLEYKDIDCIVVVTFTLLLGLSRKFKNKKKIVFFDGCPFATKNKIPGQAKKITFMDQCRIIVYTYLMGTKVIFLPISQWAANTFLRYFQKEKSSMRVCYPYSRLSVRSEQSPVKAETADVQDPLNLLFVGNYLLEKGGLDLVEIFEKKLKSFCNLTIVTQQKIDALSDNILVRNDITSDKTEEMKNIYGESDIFVFPSGYDFFGLVVLEAMSQGLPVIAFDIAAIGEMIEDHVNGILIPYTEDRFEKLAEAILWFVKNREMISVYGNNSLHKIESNFGRDRFVRQLSGVI